MPLARVQPHAPCSIVHASFPNPVSVSASGPTASRNHGTIERANNTCCMRRLKLVVRLGIAMYIDIRSGKAADTDTGALVNVYKLLQTGGLRQKLDNCCHCKSSLFTVGWFNSPTQFYVRNCKFSLAFLNQSEMLLHMSRSTV